MRQTLVPALEWKDPTKDRAWDIAIGAEPDASPFHTSAWARVLMASYGHRPFYGQQQAGQKGGPLIPMMEVRSWIAGCRGVALPFTDFCPTLGSGGQEAFEALCELGRARRWKFLELRGEEIVPEDAPAAREYDGHQLDLEPGFANVMRGYSRAARAGVRKAKESGVDASVSASETALMDYYQLHARTRRRHGLPPQPWSFFANLQKYILDADLGFIVLARFRSQPVSGALFLCHGRRAVYKYGATDLGAQALRPSNLVMATAIRHLTELGMDSLHLGRTSLENEGLRFFKEAWGARRERIQYHRFDLATRMWVGARSRESRMSRTFFRHMPLVVNRVLGALLYPHLD